jgi:hypothetical protein
MATMAAARLTAMAALSGRCAVQPTHTVTAPSCGGIHHPLNPPATSCGGPSEPAAVAADHETW